MSITDTPPQPDEDGGINDLPKAGPAHITRDEFDTLCKVVARTHRSVSRIEKVIIGENPLKPDPTSIAMRVDDHERIVKQTRRLAWGAVTGTLALIGHKAWASLTGSHP
jgi:hypothetical protein